MSCLSCIIENLGDNDYKIPHMNKAKMEQEGTLAMVLHVMSAVELLMKMMDATDEKEINEDDEELENMNYS